MYPQGDVCKRLGVNLAKKGFLQEEADHMGICVQQPPPEHAFDFSTRVAVGQIDSGHDIYGIQQGALPRAARLGVMF